MHVRATYTVTREQIAENEIDRYFDADDVLFMEDNAPCHGGQCDFRQFVRLPPLTAHVCCPITSPSRVPCCLPLPTDTIFALRWRR